MPVFSQSIQPLWHCQCLQCCINISVMPSCCRLFTNTDPSSVMKGLKSFNASVRKSVSLNQRFNTAAVAFEWCVINEKLTSSYWCYRRCNTSGMWCCVVRWTVPDISKEHCAFIFRVRQWCSTWGTVTLWNNGNHSHNDTSSHPRRPEPSTNLPVVCKPDMDRTTLRLTVQLKFQCDCLQH